MKPQAEMTLDPKDWEEMRTLGHRMVDDMINHLSSLNEQPAWKQVPADIKSRLREPLPVEGQGEQKVYERFLTDILPYPLGNLHPRFYGWVIGNGLPFGMFADMLAAGINSNVTGFNQMPAFVEQQALEWMAEMVGMPKGTSGLFVSGASMANILGVAVARAAKAGFDTRDEGMQGDQKKLVVYCCAETHNWVKKAVQVLGFGHRYLRSIPADKDYRMDVHKLQEAITADRAQGYQPVCVIGTAGTVNTGATDDLDAIADICQKENIWFHIDGAFGAMAYLPESSRHLVKGMQRADSLAFDLHKWMCLPYESACILVKDGKAHRDAFAVSANYLMPAERGTAAGGTFLAERGLELSRSFKALKVWMCLKAYGVKAFADLVEQNIRQVQHLKSRVEQSPELELLAPAPMNILCFRYVADGLNEQELATLNQEIIFRLQEDGIAVPTSTLVNGTFAIRVANVNHRTCIADFDLLADSVLRLGKDILAETIQTPKQKAV